MSSRRLLASREKRRYRARASERMQTVKADKRREAQVQSILGGIDVPPPGQSMFGQTGLSQAQQMAKRPQKKGTGLFARTAHVPSGVEAMEKLMEIIDKPDDTGPYRHDDADARALPPLGKSASFGFAVGRPRTRSKSRRRKNRPRAGAKTASDSQRPKADAIAEATLSTPALSGVGGIKQPYAPVPTPGQAWASATTGSLATTGLGSGSGVGGRGGARSTARRPHGGLPAQARMRPSSLKPLSLKATLKAQAQPVPEIDETLPPGAPGGPPRERPKSKSGYRRRFKKQASDRNSGPFKPFSQGVGAYFGGPAATHAQDAIGRHKLLRLTGEGEFGTDDWRLRVTALDSATHSQQTALLKASDAQRALLGAGPLAAMMRTREASQEDVRSLVSVAFGEAKARWASGGDVAVAVDSLDAGALSKMAAASKAGERTHLGSGKIHGGAKTVELGMEGDFGTASWRLAVTIVEDKPGADPKGKTHLIGHAQAATALNGYSALMEALTKKEFDSAHLASLASAVEGGGVAKARWALLRESLNLPPHTCDLGAKRAHIEPKGGELDEPSWRLRLALTDKGGGYTQYALMTYDQAAVALGGRGPLMGCVTGRGLATGDARRLCSVAFGDMVLGTSAHGSYGGAVPGAKAADVGPGVVSIMPQGDPDDDSFSLRLVLTDKKLALAAGGGSAAGNADSEDEEASDDSDDDRAPAVHMAVLSALEAQAALSSNEALLRLVKEHAVDIQHARKLVIAAWGKDALGTDPAQHRLEHDHDATAEHICDLGAKISRIKPIGGELGDRSWRLRVELTDKGGGYVQYALIREGQAAAAVKGHHNLVFAMAREGLTQNDAKFLASSAFGDMVLGTSAQGKYGGLVPVAGARGADVGPAVLSVWQQGGELSGDGTDPWTLRLVLTEKQSALSEAGHVGNAPGKAASGVGGDDRSAASADDDEYDDDDDDDDDVDGGGPPAPRVHMAELDTAEALKALETQEELARFRLDDGLDIQHARRLVKAAFGSAALGTDPKHHQIDTLHELYAEHTCDLGAKTSRIRPIGSLDDAYWQLRIELTDKGGGYTQYAMLPGAEAADALDGYDSLVRALAEDGLRDRDARALAEAAFGHEVLATSAHGSFGGAVPNTRAADLGPAVLSMFPSGGEVGSAGFALRLVLTEKEGADPDGGMDEGDVAVHSAALSAAEAAAALRGDAELARVLDDAAFDIRDARALTRAAFGSDAPGATAPKAGGRGATDLLEHKADLGAKLCTVTEVGGGGNHKSRLWRLKVSLTDKAGGYTQYALMTYDQAAEAMQGEARLEGVLGQSGLATGNARELAEAAFGPAVLVTSAHGSHGGAVPLPNVLAADLGKWVVSLWPQGDDVDAPDFALRLAMTEKEYADVAGDDSDHEDISAVKFGGLSRAQADEALEGHAVLQHMMSETSLNVGVARALAVAAFGDEVVLPDGPGSGTGGGGRGAHYVPDHHADLGAKVAHVAEVGGAGNYASPGWRLKVSLEDKAGGYTQYTLMTFAQAADAIHDAAEVKRIVEISNDSLDPIDARLLAEAAFGPAVLVTSAHGSHGGAVPIPNVLAADLGGHVISVWPQGDDVDAPDFALRLAMTEKEYAEAGAGDDSDDEDISAVKFGGLSRAQADEALEGHAVLQHMMSETSLNVGVARALAVAVFGEEALGPAHGAPGTVGGRAGHVPDHHADLGAKVAHVAEVGGAGNYASPGWRLKVSLEDKAGGYTQYTLMTYDHAAEALGDRQEVKRIVERATDVLDSKDARLLAEAAFGPAVLVTSAHGSHGGAVPIPNVLAADLGGHVISVWPQGDDVDAPDFALRLAMTEKEYADVAGEDSDHEDISAVKFGGLSRAQADEALEGHAVLQHMMSETSLNVGVARALAVAVFGEEALGPAHGAPDAASVYEAHVADLGSKTVRYSTEGSADIGDPTFRLTVTMTDKAGGYTQFAVLTLDEASSALMGYGELSRVLADTALSKEDGRLLAEAAFGHHVLLKPAHGSHGGAVPVPGVLAADLGDHVVSVWSQSNDLEDPDFQLRICLTDKTAAAAAADDDVGSDDGDGEAKKTVHMEAMTADQAAAALLGYGEVAKLLARDMLDVEDARRLATEAFGEDMLADVDGLDEAAAKQEADEARAEAAGKGAGQQAGIASRRGSRADRGEVYYQGGRKVCGRYMMATAYPEPMEYSTDDPEAPPPEPEAGAERVVTVELYDTRIQQHLTLSFPRGPVASLLHDLSAADEGARVSVALLRSVEGLLVVDNPRMRARTAASVSSEAGDAGAEDVYRNDADKECSYAALVAAYPALLARFAGRAAVDGVGDVDASLVYLMAPSDVGPNLGPGAAGLSAQSSGLHAFYQVRSTEAEGVTRGVLAPVEAVAPGAHRGGLAAAVVAAASRLGLAEDGLSLVLKA